MEANILKIVGQIAGLGGLSLGIVLILFKEIIKKEIFPKLTKKQAHSILRLILILSWLTGIFGLSIWAYVEIGKNKEKKTISPNSNYKSIDSTKPSLKFVDIDTETGNSVEFKLKNSGNDTAFLTHVEIIFYAHHIVWNPCYMVANHEYKYPSYKNNFVFTKLEVKKCELLDEENNNFIVFKNEGLCLNQDKPILSISRESSLPTFVHEYKIDIASTGKLKVSQAVPPKGVDRFSVNLSTYNLGLKSHPWCGGTVGIEGYAILYYDGSKSIKSKNFTIGSNSVQLKKANLSYKAIAMHSLWVDGMKDDETNDIFKISKNTTDTDNKKSNQAVQRTNGGFR